MRVDGHVIAGGRDRAGRTQIEAASAADDLGTGMRAQLGVERDVTRLVEAADEIARREHGFQHRRAVGGIGTQVASAQIGCGEERCSTAKIEQDVALRDRAVAPGTEAQYVA